MIKKIIFILVLFFISPCFAGENSCSDMAKFLKLSQKQTDKIDDIKKQDNIKIASLNADIILLKMEIAQLRVRKNTQAKINSLNSELELVQKEIIEIKNNQEKEIVSNFGLIQKYKYNKYCRIKK